MKPEHPKEMEDKALAAFFRTDGARMGVVAAQWIKFNGQYVIVREDDEVMAVYKVIPRLGSGTAVPGGGVVVNSFSVGLKRLKRYPKGLLEAAVA